MKLNKSALTGTGKVFSFTFLQFFKNKSNLISLIILFLLTVASVPLMTLIGGGSTKQAANTDITQVWITDETGYFVMDQIQPLLESDLALKEYWAPAAFTLSDPGFDLAESDVYAHLYETTGEGGSGYGIALQTLAKSNISDNDLSALQSLLTEAFNYARMRTLGISENQLAVLNSGWEVTSESLDDYLEPEDENRLSTTEFVQLFYSILVMIVSVYCASYIIRAVIEEKASKLVELLMVSVKPLALLVGKILAALVYVLTLFAILIGGYAISYFVSDLFLEVDASGNLFAQMGFVTTLLNLGADTFVILLFSLLLAFLTFAIIAGLSASGCSTMEDMQGAATASTALAMAGYLISFFVAGVDVQAFRYLISLFPILSVFCAPVQYIMGNIGIGIILLSWLIQIGVIVMLALFGARIYENLIMYRGSRLKFVQMFTMAKQNRKEKGGA